MSLTEKAGIYEDARLSLRYKYKYVCIYICLVCTSTPCDLLLTTTFLVQVPVGSGGAKAGTPLVSDNLKTVKVKRRKTGKGRTATLGRGFSLMLLWNVNCLSEFGCCEELTRKIDVVHGVLTRVR